MRPDEKRRRLEATLDRVQTKGRRFRPRIRLALEALFTAYHLGAKAIVALTESGATALWLSRHWTHVPIFALTPRVASERAMALFRNVTPLAIERNSDKTGEETGKETSQNRTKNAKMPFDAICRRGTECASR